MAEKVEYNLFARFRFLDQGSSGQMRQTSGAFAALHRSATMAKAGVQQIGRGFRTLGMMGMGVGVVIGGIVKKGAEFYKQMSVVRSVTSMTNSEFASLKQQALGLGASTSFTSTQAAQGMENLARAGFNVKEVMSAIEPTLKMAEADSMSLASASNIVASAIRSFGLKANSATMVADSLAYVSKNANTNISELGESLKYAGAISKMAGQNFQDTVGMLGLLADIGLKGSLAGTALKNAIMKLTQQSEAAIKLFGGKAGLRAVLTDTTGKMRPMKFVIGDVIKKLSSVKNEADRSSIAFKIFGIRGIGAMSGLRSASAAKIDTLLRKIKTESIGTANAMAKMRLNNVAGQWVLFKSALDNVAVALFTTLRTSIASVFSGPNGAISTMQKFGDAIYAVNAGATESSIVKKYGKTVADIIFGVKEGVQSAWKTFKAVGKTILSVFSQFTGGSTNSRKSIIKLVSKIGALIVMITPIAGIIGVIGVAAGGLFNILSGGFKVINALTSRWGLVLMGLVYVFSGGQREGESFFKTMARGLKGVIDLANQLLWPFKMLAKHLGALPALMAGIGIYKGGKFLLGKAGSFLSASGSPIARALGGILGAAGRTGMPVYITNWAEMPGGGITGALGAAGGLAGALGTAGAAGAGMAQAGLMARLGMVAGGVGVSRLGLMFGGKFATGGTIATSGTAGGTAATVATIGTAVTAIGALTATLAPAVAGIVSIGNAYDPAYQARYRDRILAPYRKQQAEARERQRREDARRAALGMGPQFQSLEFLKRETWQQYHLRKKIGETGVHLGHAATLKRGLAGLRTGDAWSAYGAVMKIGQTRFEKTFAQMSDYDLKLYGLTREQVDVLRAIAKASSNTVDAISRGWQTTINLDGRQIAIVNAQSQQNTTERSGRPIESGARSRAARTGNR